MGFRHNVAAWGVRRLPQGQRDSVRGIVYGGAKNEFAKVEKAQEELLSRLKAKDYSNDSIRLAFSIKKFIEENKGQADKKLFKECLPAARGIIDNMAENTASQEDVEFLKKSFKQYIKSVEDNIFKFVTKKL